MKIYRGFGARRGIRVEADEGFQYAAAHLDEPGGEEFAAEGVTAAELEEWYFSGSFILEERPE